MLTSETPAKPNPSFRFESFGVRVEIISNEPDVVGRAAEVARRSLLDDIRPVTGDSIDHRFELHLTKGSRYKMIIDGEEIARGRSAKKFFKFLDSMIRVTIGEFAADRVFLHAGVVSWKGKAIIMPADSFQGKTTLTAELVKKGAVYISDEFAILDEAGMVHPFVRPLSMRKDNAEFTPYELTAADLGGTFATVPVPVGMILLTGYKPGARWSPKILTPGEGVLRMLPYALSLRYKPEFSLQTLNFVASRAIIASSRRGTAENFVETLLNFVDKHVN